MNDHDALVDMGFDPRRVKLALSKTGGLQDAITWLDEHSETSIEDLEAKFGGAANKSAAAAAGGAEDDLDGAEDQGKLAMDAKSLKCKECGKLFSTPERAQFHAVKTEHDQFEESSEEVKPLTAEEKVAKLAELRAKLALKREAEKKADIELAKQNEKIRRTKDQDSERLKEELKKKEQMKEIEKQKKEKAADILARKKVEAQIKAAQEERRRAKAEREGRAVPQAPAAAPVAAPAAPAVTANYDHARLQFRIPGKSALVKNFPADTTLFEVAAAIHEESGFEVNSFTTTFPRKTFTTEEYGLTLKEAKLVPSAALIVG